MDDSGYKTCPFCKEKIRATAIKCRYCAEWLEVPAGEVAPKQAGVRVDAQATSLPSPEPTSRGTLPTGQLPVQAPTLTTLAREVRAPTASNGTAEMLVPQLSAPVGDERYMPPETRTVPQNDPLAKETPDSTGEFCSTVSRDHVTEEVPKPPEAASLIIAKRTRAAQIAKDRGNYFARHWRGELPLRTSYWVNCFLVTLFLRGLLAGLTPIVSDVGLMAIAAFTIGAYFLLTCISVWQIVGTWRSAAASESRGWGAIAQLLMVVYALGAASQIIGTVTPQVTEFCQIIAGDTGLPACDIQMFPNGMGMELRGGLRAGSAKKLAGALARAPQVRILYVNSVGGRLSEAEQMAQMVKERGLTTYVSEQCLSAATIVFLAGKKRVVTPGARVGFHRGDFPGLTLDGRMALEAQDRERLRSAGVAEWFITQAVKTPPEDMWYPTFDELLRAGVATSAFLEP